jgi:hypothetical protein
MITHQEYESFAKPVPRVISELSVLGMGIDSGKPLITEPRTIRLAFGTQGGFAPNRISFQMGKNRTI